MSKAESQPSILIVDDSPEILDALGSILSDYRRFFALNGEKALAKAHSTPPPDLILLDILMPEMDGYDVCRKLKADPLTRDIPVIFITAKTEVEDETRGFDLGAVDYITKPFMPQVVKARVRTHLELRFARENLKKQNEILKENAKLREDVERIARHDIKSSLNAVISAPQLLMLEKNLTSNQREILQMIEESGYRMLEIIDSSLNLFKMETGKYRLNPVPVDLLCVLRRIHGEARDLMSFKKLEFDIRVREHACGPNDSFMIWGEELLFYSMLANLLKNAVEASPAASRIGIFLEDDGPAIIRIHNQGAVPPEIRATFFEKYVTSGKSGGTGLGTYSARLIAQTLGGDIEMTSSEDAGTTVSICLPLRASGIRPAPAKENAAGDRPAADLRILVVDDYAPMRRMIMGLLRQMGYSAFSEAENGEAAMHVLAREQIDVIVCDMNMPVMDGMSLMAKVAADERFDWIPFLMTTGEKEYEDVLEGLKSGCSDYILKPFSADSLEAKLRGLLVRDAECRNDTGIQRTGR